jgi:hypothetical protein
MRFKQWLNSVEEGLTPPAQFKPGMAQAADLATDALARTPLKPGETPASLLAKPDRQVAVLKTANQVARQKGTALNLGATAHALDKDQVLGV